MIGKHLLRLHSDGFSFLNGDRRAAASGVLRYRSKGALMVSVATEYSSIGLSKGKSFSSNPFNLYCDTGKYVLQ